VRHRIYECIVLFIAAYLANKKSGIEHQANNNQHEEDNSKNQQRHFPPIKQNPADVQRNCKGHEASPESDEEGYGFPSTTDWHGCIVAGAVDSSPQGAGGRRRKRKQ
jgi:hypothetical protein